MKQHFTYFGLVLLACLISIGLEQGAQAQSGYGSSYLESIRNQNSARRYSVRAVQGQVANRSVSASGVLGVNRQTYSSLFPTPSQRSKPFSGLQRGPAVSPYLSLSGSLNGVSDYYNVVRPQQERERQNLQQQRQLNVNRHRLNQIAAQGPYSLQGDPNLAATGHTTTYMYMGNFQTTGNYFPPLTGTEKPNIFQ